MIIPAVVSALVLGIAFDVPSLTTKPQYIFDQEDINKSMVSIQNPFTRSHYRLIQDSADSNDFLGVDGELSLKAKYGWEGSFQGLGKYLSHPVNRKKTIELLCTVNHQTVVETFPSYVRQREEWREKSPEQVGTHYIRSVVYGGRLVVSYKMIVHREEDVEEVKAGVEATFATKSGSFDARVAGNLQLLERRLGGKFRAEIAAFATAGLFGAPTDLEGVLALVREYPALVGRVGGGKGAPVRLDVQPLGALDPKYAYTRLGGMGSVFDEAINKLEDMRAADLEFREWEKKQLWNDQQQEEIDRYFRRLREALGSMKRAVSSLDAREGVSRGHFDEAFRAYGHGPDNVPFRYTRELHNLTHHVENIPFYWHPYTTATTHYTHWGSVRCSLPSPEPVFVGYAASSPRGFGSGGDLLCLDVEPHLGSARPPEELPVSRLTGLTYETPDHQTGFAYCAFCRLENATAVEVVAGRTSCPADTKLEYAGYLAANLHANSVTVCMEGHPDDQRVDLHAGVDPAAGRLVPLWERCEACDGDEDWERGRFISCVVCSR